MPPLPRISETDLDSMCRILADSPTHKELTLLLRDCNIQEAGGTPKWERMLLSLGARQRQDNCGNNVIGFFTKVLHPSRFRDKPEEFESFRTQVNYHLAFYGISITEKGEAVTVPKASTLSEAEQRANELQAELRRRSVHVDVLKFCRAEYLQQNYFHCVLEASKSLAQKIRDKTGLTGDGAELVRPAFSLKNPLLALNALSTDTEKSDQSGFSNLLTGIFGTFRNVTAHGPKIHWAVNKQDALDALTIISYAHRRLDDTIVVPQSKS
ncbi:MAG TPA: TIGR02391 family protein [bacterium]|nr:TIGR02391 family protein [bacterium]